MRSFILIVAIAACSSSNPSSTASLPSAPASPACPERSSAFPFDDHFVTVAPTGLPSIKMRYVEAGAGSDVFVLVHGVPTSAYLWRNVIPGLAKAGRVIALDLPGFGKSVRPDAPLDAASHAAYLGAFLDQLKLRNVVLVVHDLGSVAGLVEASRHPERLRGLVMMEALIPDTIPASIAQSPSLCKAAQPDAPACLWMFLRSPTGRAAIRDQNFFIEAAVGGDPFCPPAAEAMAVYRESFPDPASREYLIPFPAAVPVDGQPSEMQPLFDTYTRWLETSPLPKLVIRAEPGFLITAKVAKYAEAHFPATEVTTIGRGLHFLQETNPTGISDAIVSWHERRLSIAR